MRSRGPARLITAVAVSALLFQASIVSMPASATDPDPGSGDGGDTASLVSSAGLESTPDLSNDVPEEERSHLLGKQWSASEDLAWSVAGDPQGLRVLSASASAGYDWREVVTLTQPGLETDRWIGNACLASDGSTLAVVYAPRHFTNNEAFALRGGYGALVNLLTGEVQQLGEGYTLAYFSPSCGLDDWVTFTQYADDGGTRLVSMQGLAADKAVAVESPTALSSAVHTGHALLAATAGAIVEVREKELVVVAKTVGNGYSLTPTISGDLIYAEVDGDTAKVHARPLAALDGEPTLLAVGTPDQVDVAGDSEGHAYILGSPDIKSNLEKYGVTAAPTSHPGDNVSSRGELTVSSAFSTGGVDGFTVMEIEASSLVTEEAISFRARPEPIETSHDAGSASRQSTTAEPHIGTTSATSPISAGSLCAVPRNDPAQQVMQPRPRQVEWAVNQAVGGHLMGNRNMGSGVYQPQDMFPKTPLAGVNAKIPRSIVLGILAQESNLWQASSYAVPGVPGNPLIGNYYGVDRASTSPNGWWQINYADADCGYGVGQVTDLMRVGQMPYKQQQAIALDYQANIARSIQILAEKWNQTHNAGMTINNGDSSHPENWFFALWAYNTGFYPQGAAGAPWGVGWFNNPVNPIYPSYRTPFLQASPADAAQPQKWPYPEKVLGFAAHSVQLTDSVSQEGNPRTDTFHYVPAFTPAWWLENDGFYGLINKAGVKPPIDLFCDSTNQCDTGILIDPDGPGGQLAGPCAHQDTSGAYDLKCYYNKPATWKTSCSNECGYDPAFAVNVPEPADAESFPAACTASALPAGALIIDNLPHNTPSKRPGCAVQPSSGSFEFTFANNLSGTYPSKVDLHQLGSGYNGQFYFTHTRVRGTANYGLIGGVLEVSGKWTLNNPLSGWATVLVHMPNHAAWAQQAQYEVNTGLKTVTRSVSQRNYANEWVSLGAMQFGGTPSVTLSNATGTFELGDGKEDIAWDAVAFVPHPKPSEFVVSLGDSYSSGEGTSPVDGSGFSRSSDNNGTNPILRNACHRSFDAWPYKIDLPSVAGTATIRDLSSLPTPVVDYHMLACSGAVTENVMPGDPLDPLKHQTQFGEDNQLDRGFVDENTTLVTMTIGGNDLGFPHIILHCALKPLCADSLKPEIEGEELPPGASLTRDWIDYRLDQVPQKIEDTLQSIKEKGPNARIVMLGYPSIFESGSACVLLPDTPGNLSWLHSVTARLNQKLTEGVAAAQAAGINVTYLSPQHEFSGRNVCSMTAAINVLITSGTPGDVPMGTVPLPGTDLTITFSAQSVHPNQDGTTLYARAANTALRLTRHPLSSSLIGGAATTYYSSLRYHAGGPASMNVRSFSPCGEEIRFGLRQGSPIGFQHTETLQWTSPNDTQTFLNIGTTSPDLPAGEYALNGRLVNTCPGGTGQPWSADLSLRAH